MSAKFKVQAKIKITAKFDRKKFLTINSTGKFDTAKIDGYNGTLFSCTT